MVWIVDDDPDDQFLLRIAFKQLIPPISIKILSDGEELLPCLEVEKELPKLILLDLNMPRKDGLTTLKEVRAIPAYKNLPIVVLTTSSALEDRQQSLLHGADDFLTKPRSHQEVIDMLRQLALAWKLTERRVGDA